MDYRDWQKRRMARPDLSHYLVHLTKGNCYDGVASMDVLLKILEEGVLKGSLPKSNFTAVGDSFVCFQDSPLQSIASNVWYENKGILTDAIDPNVRYTSVGLIFKKKFIFKKGGRPVIYDIASEAKKYLPKEEYWRIVSTDLGDSEQIIDWTHEREWRIPSDLEFELSDIGVIIGNNNNYRSFIEACKKADFNILEEILGIVNLSLIF